MEKKISVLEANRVGARLENDPEFNIEGRLGEATDEMKDWLAELGLFVANGMFYYNPESLGLIAEVVHQIIEDEVKGEHGPTWYKFKLRGDDDVDFCGTYILSALEVAYAIEEEPIQRWERIVTANPEVLALTSRAVAQMLYQLDLNGEFDREELHVLERDLTKLEEDIVTRAVLRRISLTMVTAGLKAGLKLIRQFDQSKPIWGQLKGKG